MYLNNRKGDEMTKRKFGCPHCKAISKHWLRATPDGKLMPAGWRWCKRCKEIFNMKDSVKL